MESTKEDFWYVIAALVPNIKKMKTGIISFFFLTLVRLSSENCNKIVCTFHARSMRQLKVDSADIDTSLCPYLKIKFVDYDYDALQVDRRVSDIYPWMWSAKAENPNMKVLLTFYNSVGCENFFEMYTTPAKRLKFIPLFIQYLRNKSFDGVEVDIGMGFVRRKSLYDIDHWADFIEDLQKDLTDESKRSGKPKLLLFGRIDDRKKSLNQLYNVSRIYRHSDFVIMDAWAYYSQRLGPRYNMSVTSMHHSKVYSVNNIKDDRSIDYNVKALIRKGGLKEKTILSLYLMPTFFYEYSSFTAIDFGWLKHDNYGAVCELMHKGGNITRVFDDCPIFMQERNVVYFDDEISIAEKVKYIKKNGLAGFEILDLSADDFKGLCGKGKFPLMKAVNDECRKP